MTTDTTRIWAQLRGRTPSDGHGTDGNERLTALSAAVLFVLLALEGITIVSLGTLLTPHMFVGVLLIPPILLKLGSTGYRFVRYYTHDAAYRAAGPPVAPLRILAPLLIILTVVVFASGVALAVAGSPHGSTLFAVHKLSFVAWIIIAAIHILYYLLRVPRLVGADLHRPPEPRGAAHRGLRFAAVAGALVVGLGLAIAFVPTAHTWEHKNPNSGAGGQTHLAPVARSTQPARTPGRGGGTRRRTGLA
jgi:hypothetical protein